MAGLVEFDPMRLQNANQQAQLLKVQLVKRRIAAKPEVIAVRKDQTVLLFHQRLPRDQGVYPAPHCLEWNVEHTLQGIAADAAPVHAIGVEYCSDNQNVHEVDF